MKYFGLKENNKLGIEECPKNFDFLSRCHRIESGYLQAVVVFILASIVNIPRWFEFDHEVRSTKIVSISVSLRQLLQECLPKARRQS